MIISMYDAENVEFKFSRLRRHLKALNLFVSNREFDGLLVLKFQLHLACQSYKLEKSIWKNFNTSFPYLELE